LKKTPEEIYQQIKGEALPPYKKFLQIVASGEVEDGTDAAIPVVKYKRN